MDQDYAIEKINESGIMLVFPIENRKEPASLWSAFFPRSHMRWEWDESGDNRVSDLWHLRTELSACSDVVYAKWFKGRATFFSHEIFVAMLAALHTSSGYQKPLGEDALKILNELLENSPQSPRVLRESTDLVGKLYASTFDRALRDLWMRLLIVGFGEFDDGAFPSLAMGATQLLFEELWQDAKGLSPSRGEEILLKKLGAENLFYKQFLRIRSKLLNSKSSSESHRPYQSESCQK